MITPIKYFLHVPKMNSWYFKHAPFTVNDNAIFPTVWARYLGVSLHFFLSLKSSSNLLASSTGSAIEIYPEIWPILPLMEDTIIFHFGCYKSPNLFPFCPFIQSSLHTTARDTFKKINIYFFLFKVLRWLPMLLRVKAKLLTMAHTALYNLVPATSLILTPVIALICPIQGYCTWWVLCLDRLMAHPLNSFQNLFRVHLFKEAFLNLLI